jgi:CheY-like chemotaxis protein
MSEETAGRVLVVDDDAATVEAVKDCLAPVGYVLHGATNGAVGLEQVITFRPEVVVFDFWMPVADGRELVQGIREVARGRIGLVAMSGTPEVEDWCTRVGVSAFVRKPFGSPEIRTAVVRALEDARSGASSRTGPDSASRMSSRRLRLEHAALVVGEASTVGVLRGLLREGQPPTQVAAVAKIEEALRAFASIQVDVVAVCGSWDAGEPGLLALVARSRERGIPILFDGCVPADIAAEELTRASRGVGPEAMAASIQEIVATRRAPRA